MRRWWRYSFDNRVPRRSLIVAALVGTILNAINQGDALVFGGKINLMKMTLTYIVPYCVATYGAVSYRIRLEQDAVRHADIGDDDCNN